MPRRMNPAQKRYVRRVFVAMVCYMVTLSIALHYVGKGHLAGPLAYLLALLPALSVSGVFWAVGQVGLAPVAYRAEHLEAVVHRQSPPVVPSVSQLTRLPTPSPANHRMAMK